MAAMKDSDLDHVLEEIGQFGKFQRNTYMFIVVPLFFSALYETTYIFTAADDTYRCVIPECDIANTPLEADWLHYAMPDSEGSRRCSRFAPFLNTSLGDSICSPDAFDQNTIIDCEDFVFGAGLSIVKELEIQCDGWKRTLVGTIHSVGLLCALPLISVVSDRYGRRLAFVSAAFLAGVFGLARSFSTSYVMFLIFEFLEPLFGSGVYSAGFILGIELVGPKRRVLGSTIICMFYSSGAMLLGLVAWLIPYWRNLLRVLYAPSLIFIVYFWVIQESVRWLISKGHFEKAVEILKKAAKKNGTTLSEKSMERLYLNAEKEHAHLKTEPEKKQNAFMQCLKSKVIMVRLITCSFWWMTSTFVYYGLSINAVSLTGNSYLNFVLVNLVELPAYVTDYLLLDRIGRKSTLCISFIAGGIACIAFPLLPEDVEWLSLVFYLLGKYFITIAFSALYVYTSELFPTCLRHSLLGTCSMIGRIGSVVAPQTPLLAEYIPGLPSYLFGSFAILAGLLMLTSPETLNIKLPDTIEEAENIVRKKKSPKNSKAETP